MSSKSIKIKSINFLFIFFLAFIFSNSLKVPMTYKTIETNISQILYNKNDNNDNIRSLVERNMEITNYKFFLMETQICVGTPEQCFNVLYDTGSV